MKLNLILGVVIITLLVVLKHYYDKNKELENTIKISNANYSVIEASLKKSNKELDLLKVEYDKNLKEYYDSISNPKVIIKEIKSNECEDIKSILDDVRKLKL